MKKDVLIFAKAPVPGASKTRLVPLLGVQGAADAGEEVAMHVLNTVTPLAKESVGYQVSLWGASNHAVLRVWAEQHNLPFSIQCDGNLGQRMRHSLQLSLSRGADQGLLIGTDCPAMTAAYLRRASAALESTDLVLGPAEDGGYILIGCKAVHGSLFDQIEWGTNRVLAQTVAQAQMLNLSVTLLETLWDVDRPEDWQRYCRWRHGQAFLNDC